MFSAVILAYFDQNPFDHLLDAGIPAEKVAALMEAHNYGLIISEYNFQEWAACWKSGRPEKERRGQELLTYVLALRPNRYLVPVPHLMRYEIGSLLGSDFASPFLPESDAAQARALLTRFAEGNATEVDRRNMLENWRKKAQTTAEANQLIDQLVSGGLQPVGDTLDQFIGANPGGKGRIGGALIRRALQGTTLTPREQKIAAKRVLRRADKCPALRAAIRTNLYVNYRIVTGKRMQHDRWDDLRHCINAPYADTFVTGDEELREAFGEIWPGGQIVTLSEFAGQIELAFGPR